MGRLAGAVTPGSVAYWAAAAFAFAVFSLAAILVAVWLVDAWCRREAGAKDRRAETEAAARRGKHLGARWAALKSQQHADQEAKRNWRRSFWAK
jgi:hypothetical protein